MPLYLRLNIVVIVVTGFFAIVLFFRNKTKLTLNWLAYSFWLLYCGAIFGFFNSGIAAPALFDLEQKLTWLSLPLIFIFGGRLTPNESRLILKCFLASVCCVSIYALTTPESFVNQPSENLVSLTWFSWSESLPIGRVYLGLYCVFGIVVAYHFANHSVRRIERTLYWLIVILLALSLVNSFAKASMALFLIILVIEILVVFYTHRRGWFYIGIGALMVTFAGLTIIENPIREVAIKVINKETFEFSNKPLLYESFNFRYVNWESSWEALTENRNWILGIGTGDAQPKLNELYQSKFGNHERNYLVLGYNSHNQFLTTWLHYGLLPLLVMTLQLLLSLLVYYQAKKKIGVYFILIVMGSCITESMFERQHGIVFYTFFQLLFFSMATDHKKQIENNP
jgi:hypothetical protein